MTGKTRTMTRWHEIALPVSIVLNLFLIAVIGGHVLHDRAPPLTGDMPLARALARAEASLPPRDASAFADVIRRDAPSFAKSRQEVIQAREELAQRVTAEKFDATAVQQALSKWREAWNAFFDEFRGPLIDALAQVSPEGRCELMAHRRSEPGAAPCP